MFILFFIFFCRLLRDRPYPRAPLTGDYKLQDAITELEWAVASGIDGFTFGKQEKGRERGRGRGGREREGKKKIAGR